MWLPHIEEEILFLDNIPIIDTYVGTHENAPY